MGESFFWAGKFKNLKFQIRPVMKSVSGGQVNATTRRIQKSLQKNALPRLQNLLICHQEGTL
jgi:hypothetical protein